MATHDWAHVWAAVHNERQALSDDLADAAAARWSEPSLCPGWEVHDVVAHLIDSAQTTRWGFVRRLIAARFDFDRDNAIGIVRERRRTPAETLAAFDEIISDTKTPPAAHDGEASWGSGPEVRGSALALLLAISGRPVALGELSGPGASALAQAD